MAVLHFGDFHVFESINCCVCVSNNNVDGRIRITCAHHRWLFPYKRIRFWYFQFRNLCETGNLINNYVGIRFQCEKSILIFTIAMSEQLCQCFWNAFRVASLTFWNIVRYNQTIKTENRI